MGVWGATPEHTPYFLAWCVSNTTILGIQKRLCWPVVRRPVSEDPDDRLAKPRLQQVVHSRETSGVHGVELAPPAGLPPPRTCMNDISYVVAATYGIYVYMLHSYVAKKPRSKNGTHEATNGSHALILLIWCCITGMQC